MIHHSLLYLLAAFLVVHLCRAIPADLEERNGVIASIVSGVKFERVEESYEWEQRWCWAWETCSSRTMELGFTPSGVWWNDQNYRRRSGLLMAERLAWTSSTIWRGSLT
jgi:hypothetical protein